MSRPHRRILTLKRLKFLLKSDIIIAESLWIPQFFVVEWTMIICNMGIERR